MFAQEPSSRASATGCRSTSTSSKQVKTEYIDPDQKPRVAQQNQVQQYGTIVFNYKGRTERDTTNTEQDITNAIIKVVSGQQRKVYFTAGPRREGHDVAPSATATTRSSRR